MTGLSRSQRFLRWCRHHPKTAGIGAAVLALFVVIGAVSDDPKHGPSENAAGSAMASPPVSTSAASASHSSSSTASRTMASPTATQVTAAAANRSQHSNRLATAVLATLAIKGRASKNGYSRDQFGSAWTDDNDDPLGHNGCDTRNDVLHRDLTGQQLKAGSNGCTVLIGLLRDPYTGHTIAFTRGQSTSSDVQIDHVVSLSDAWQKGAQRYDTRTRTNIANDPLNLLAVDGPTNESKGDGDTATWLPPNKRYRCAYVARQIAVKARYRLWMTSAERDAASRVLNSCPGHTVPQESGSASIANAPKPTPSETHKPKPAPEPDPSTPASDVYYENCDAVRAAGAAPLYAGQPGYDSHLDRDGDGIACE